MIHCDVASKDHRKSAAFGNFKWLRMGEQNLEKKRKKNSDRKWLGPEINFSQILRPATAASTRGSAGYHWLTYDLVKIWECYLGNQSLDYPWAFKWCPMSISPCVDVALQFYHRWFCTGFRCGSVSFSVSLLACPWCTTFPFLTAITG